MVGGSNCAISGSIISNMAADGHLGMTALSCVTLASAGLSCFCVLQDLERNLQISQQLFEGIKGLRGPYLQAAAAQKVDALVLLELILFNFDIKFGLIGLKLV